MATEYIPVEDARTYVFDNAFDTYVLIPGRSSTYYSYSPTDSDTDTKFYLAIPVDYIGTIQEYLNLAYESLLAYSDPGESERNRRTYLCPTVMLDAGVLRLLSANVADTLIEHALNTSKTELQLHPSLEPREAVMLSIPKNQMDKVYEDDDTYFDRFCITYAYILLNKGLWTIVIEFQANGDRHGYTILDGVAWIDLN
jgi:hypothetical protein